MGEDLIDNYIIYGRHVVQEYFAAIGDISSIESVCLLDSLKVDRDFSYLKQLPISKILRMPRKKIDLMYPELNHQGIVVTLKDRCSPYNRNPDKWTEFIKKGNGLLLALDGIQDPHNLGGIIRSAEVLGVNGIFITGRGATPGPTVDRASAGASFHLPIFTISSPDRLLDTARKAGFWITVSTGSEKHENLKSGQMFIESSQTDKFPEYQETLLFIGNESKGVRQLIRKKADFIISIPMRGKVSSLNAGVAAAILMERLINNERKS